MIIYPRKLREIHQIEITTRCNLKCHYCPHYPELPRPKEDMSFEVYEKSLNIVKYFVKTNTQTELSLTGIGEPTLHPQFIEFIALARKVIGDNRKLTFSTNGILFTEELCREISKYKPEVYISLHRPEYAGHSIQLAKKYNIFGDYNNSFATSSFNWAGYQKNWYVSAESAPCDYLRLGWGVILVDGRIAVCCLDADGSSSIGTIANNPERLTIEPWSGCNKCHLHK